MKIVKRVILGIVILLILAVAVVWLLIDPIAKSAVVSGASDTLGVRTSLQSIKVSPLQGRVLMNELNISNPEGGFVSAFLMDAKRFEIEVAPASLFSDTVEIRKFEIDGLEMHIEQKLPLSNVSIIMNNIKRSSEEKPAAKSQGKKVKADLILIKNVEAYFHLLPGTSKAGILKVKVPQIELKNVSSDKTGNVTGQLVRQLFPAVLSSIIRQGQGLVPTDFLVGLDHQVVGLAQSLGEQMSKLVKPIGEGLQKTVEQTHLDKPVEEAAKTLEEGAKGAVEGLFGPKKKPQQDQSPQ